MSKPVAASTSRSEEPLDLNSGRQHRSLWGDAMRRLTKNPGSMIGLALLIVIAAFSFCAWVTHFDPVEIVPSERL